MTVLIDNLGGLIGFGEYHLNRGDDNIVTGIDLATVFGAGGLKLLGVDYSYLSIATNGNVALSNDAAFGVRATHGFELNGTGYAVLAPFLGDAMTYLGDAPIGPDQVTPTPGGTSRGSDLVWYDLDATGDGALTVTWDDVSAAAYTSVPGQGPTALNAFQLQIVGRGSGNFDIVLRYEHIDWGLSPQIFRSEPGLYDGSVGWQAMPYGWRNQVNPATAEGNTGIVGYSIRSVRSGTVANDSLQGTTGDDILAGGGGRDRVWGGRGDDLIAGSAGRDTLMGGGGNDAYVVDGIDSIVELEGRGRDIVFSRSSHALGNELEDLVLTGSADVDATGNALANVLAGNAGDNVLDGGEGRDTADYSRGRPGVTVDLSWSGPQTIRNSEQDTLVNIENVIGSDWEDVLIGDANANILAGGYGNDTLSGSAGNDTLIGGAGRDVFSGGPGKDVFRFLPGDTTFQARVVNFQAGSDRIDLSSFDLKPQLAGRQGFTYIGTEHPVDGLARGVLWFEDGVLFGSTDADWHVEFSIILTGVTSLSELDLIL